MFQIVGAWRVSVWVIECKVCKRVVYEPVVNIDDGGGDDIADDLDEGAEGEGEGGEEGEEGVIIKGGRSAVWTVSKNF